MKEKSYYNRKTGNSIRRYNTKYLHIKFRTPKYERELKRSEGRNRQQHGKMVSMLHFNNG